MTKRDEKREEKREENEVLKEPGKQSIILRPEERR